MQLDTLPYNDYGGVMRHRLGGRVQKLAIDAHLGCPHRNATLQTGGCSFCLGEAFSPSYCQTQHSITEQINAAIEFHTSRRRHADKYLAYFQAGTNTFAPVERLQSLYTEALSHPNITGIIVGTRPDCISSEILDLLEYISHNNYVAVEYGIETTSDSILQHVNRGHNFATAIDAVHKTKSRGMDVGAHLILGLPHQRHEQIMEDIAAINTLGIDFVKFHQLQIYRTTPIAEEWRNHPERFLFAGEFNVDDYVDLMCNIIRQLSPSIAIERFASQAPPHHILCSPLRGIRIDMLKSKIVARLQQLNATQGDLLKLLSRNK